MPTATLAPEVRRLLDTAKAANLPAWNTVSWGDAQASFLSGARASAGELPPLAAVENLSIPRPNGETIGARLYVPSLTPSLRPTLLYFHGGGFVLGSLDSHDALCHHLCAQSGVQVLAVDYRLAPKHPFPAALDDAVVAAKWLVDHVSAIHADPARLAIGGDSAGANLATSACRLLHAANTRMFRYQLLIYPMLDLRLNHPSVQTFGEGYRLTGDILRWFVASYVGVTDHVSNPLISPLLAPDLDVLPAALVLTAGFDPLRDEGLAYSAALRDAGVPCESIDCGDMIHGFCNMPGSLQQARETLAVLGHKLAQALA